MSQVLINHYLAELDRLNKVGGTHRESVVREVFKDLLKGWGRQHNLTFIPEYKLDSATKDKGPTIRKKSDTYRFADHKENVLDLLARVTRVSVETTAIVDAMREAKR